MKFQSVNPHNGQRIAEYSAHTNEEISDILVQADEAFHAWREVSVDERATLIGKAGNVLRDYTEIYARMITTEMGKPITEARSEVKKCAWVCDYYSRHAASFLAENVIQTDAQKTFVRNDPIGCVLAIMPWNFPFWQVFRFAAPTLTAGNTGILKHATNVFRKAGYPQGVFQNLIMHHDEMEDVIGHETIRAVTLTGSERAGTSVGQVSGKYLKKSVLELGGNNAFIVWEDADLDKAVSTAVTARMLNAGQSCIAAKRFILVGEAYATFVDKFHKAASQLISGDPMDEQTQIGPLARKDLADTLRRQVDESVGRGAELLLGGKQEECYYAPTVLGSVTPGMPAFDEETFGPLAAMIHADDIEHAFALSEQSKYGLGVTVCTTDIDRALAHASRVSDGAYFVNELVKSDPRLPFGGQKNSGYGRELAQDGILEFINRKTVYVK
jgi:succinate-semialdehyde dehydrogenase/glutarate-semialdehyde dehydrogenase